MGKKKQAVSRAYLFESMPIPKAVVNLCIPTIISSLVMVLYSMVDTYFVGQLNDPVQNAAVTLAGPVLLAFNAINNLFGVGSSSMMSRAMGRKDEEAVRRSSATGLYLAVCGGILISVLFTLCKGSMLLMLGANETTLQATSAYMRWTVTCGAVPAILNVVMAYQVRAEGASLHASIGTMSGAILNIFLDPIFILPWGLNMGAAGAGLATFLANCVACTYFLILMRVKKGKTSVCLNPSKVTFNKVILWGICVVGIPAMIQNLLNVTGMTILNNFMSGYGADAVAAMGISQKIQMVPWYISFGISQGIMPLVSYNFSSGNSKRMKEAITFAAKVSVSMIVCMAVLLSIFSGNVIYLFMKTDTVVLYGTKFLRALAFALPFIVVDFLAVGVFQACGFGKYSLIFAILRKVILEIPILFALQYFVGIYGIPYAQFLAEVVLAVAAVLMLRRVLRSVEEQKITEDL